jgi:hypothetical protein
MILCDWTMSAKRYVRCIETLMVKTIQNELRRWNAYSSVNTKASHQSMSAHAHSHILPTLPFKVTHQEPIMSTTIIAHPAVSPLYQHTVRIIKAYRTYHGPDTHSMYHAQRDDLVRAYSTTR